MTGGDSRQQPSEGQNLSKWVSIGGHLQVLLTEPRRLD